MNERKDLAQIAYNCWRADDWVVWGQSKPVWNDLSEEGKRVWRDVVDDVLANTPYPDDTRLQMAATIAAGILASPARPKGPGTPDELDWANFSENVLMVVDVLISAAQKKE